MSTKPPIGSVARGRLRVGSANEFADGVAACERRRQPNATAGAAISAGLRTAKFRPFPRVPAYARVFLAGRVYLAGRPGGISRCQEPLFTNAWYGRQGSLRRLGHAGCAVGTLTPGTIGRARFAGLLGENLIDTCAVPLSGCGE
jgi:hypothetical protein